MLSKNSVFDAMMNIADDFEKLAELNSAYSSDSEDKITSKERDALFFSDPENEIFHSDTVIKNNLCVFHRAICERIIQLENNELWASKPVVSEKEFRRSPRTIAKTTQEILTHPTERMSFNRAELKFQEQLNEAINNIIIDPTLISDTLLINLGLSKYIPPKGSNASEKILFRAQAIHEIREMILSLDPLRKAGEQNTPKGQIEDLRLFEITKGLNTGMLLGTVNRSGKKHFYITDLLSAECRIVNIENGYVEEVEKLDEIAERIQRAKQLMEEWNMSDFEIDSLNFDERIRVIKSELHVIVNSLEKVINPHKQQLHMIIESCLDFKDSKNRSNPSATMAKFTKAQAHVAKRHKEISAISAYLSADKTEIQRQIKHHLDPMFKFLNEVEEMHEKFAIINPNIEIDSGKRNQIIIQLRERALRTEKMKFEPFKSIAEKFRTQIDEIVCDLQSQNKEKSSSGFVKLYFIAKIARVYYSLHELFTKIKFDPDSLYPPSLIFEIDRIKEQFANITIAPDIKIPEYNDAYEKIRYLLNSMRKRMIELVYDLDADDDEAVIIREIKRKFPRLGLLVTVLRDIFTRTKNQKKALENYSSLPLRNFTRDEKNEKFEIMLERFKNLNIVEIIKQMP